MLKELVLQLYEGLLVFVQLEHFYACRITSRPDHSIASHQRSVFQAKTLLLQRLWVSTLCWGASQVRELVLIQDAHMELGGIEMESNWRRHVSDEPQEEDSERGA